MQNLQHVRFSVTSAAGAAGPNSYSTPDFTTQPCYFYTWCTDSMEAALAASCLHCSLLCVVQPHSFMQVRCGLESPEGGTYQQRVGHMRLLGEMYNFRLVDSRYASITTATVY